MVGVWYNIRDVGITQKKVLTCIGPLLETKEKNNV